MRKAWPSTPTHCPPTDLEPHLERPSPPAGWIFLTMVEKCATVQEAIDLAEHHRRTHWGIPMKYRVLLADATGDAVVVSAGPDGELAFTRKPEGDGYVDAILGVDGKDEFTIYVAPVGKVTLAAFHFDH